jgi:hypothetical protein
MNPGSRVVFGIKAAEKIRTTVQRVEKMVQGQNQDYRPRAVIAGIGPGQLCVTNGPITARSGTTAGGGNVALWTSTNGSLTTQNDANGNPIIMHVYSLSSTNGGIANGVFAVVTLVINSDTYITTLDCGN